MTDESQDILSPQRSGKIRYFALYYYYFSLFVFQVACNLPCSALTTYSAAERIRGSVERAVEARGQARVMVVGAGGLGPGV